ncbi:ESX secretion-associated protein EspG [Nocardia sp. NBC_01503]|uniref:ESX secretion-associated protein EspG n=1 Tax=Nocardia sp. NBC_01503 TaxID=2975997 RepID=UPI002E7B772E|nr:ESX secretion-associated protein EspG [Nocardia sp. NBC_01503]WTL30478.1 ESX secretion-associated protein EspG [Nocardia sp. NBC_01503]
MTHVWRFTEVEFALLWRDTIGDQLPAPFLFTSRAASPQEYRATRQSARESLQEKMTREVTDIIDAMAKSDLHLSVYGGDDRDPIHSGSMIRVLATRKGERGYLVTQLPGVSYFDRGGYTIAQCDPLRLADKIVESLPDVPAAARGDIELTSSDAHAMLYVDRSEADDLEYASSRSVVDPYEDEVSSRSARFLRAPATNSGEIQITQGSSIFGPRGVKRHTVGWRDLDGHGRYVISDRPAAALAADPKRFVSVLNSRIAAVVHAIKEEREHLH